LISALRLIALLEGVSFLLLLGVAMPLKYYWDMPLAVKYTGMAHGILFIMYVLLVLVVRSDKEWSLKTTFIALIMSIIPFGTFYADVAIFRR